MSIAITRESGVKGFRWRGSAVLIYMEKKKQVYWDDRASWGSDDELRCSSGRRIRVLNTTA